MELLYAVLLGIVEGLTEFLPVSSTGHLIIVERLSGFKTPDSFKVIIQFGAIVAVLFHFRRRFASLAGSFISLIKNKSGKKALTGHPLFVLTAALLPALFFGALFSSFVKRHFFNDITVSVMLVLVGIVIIILEKRKYTPMVHSLETVSLKKALYIGLCQCLALIPGTSRSAATILGGMFFSLDRKTAAEFSFFLAVPTMLAATVHDLPDFFREKGDPVFLLTGFIVSFFVALIVIRWFISFISRRSFIPFAVYRILLGLGLIIGRLIW